MSGEEFPQAKRARLEDPTASLLTPATEEEEEGGMAGNRVVLLLCGSFSPITNFHLRMLGEAQIENASRGLVGARGCAAVYLPVACGRLSEVDWSCLLPCRAGPRLLAANYEVESGPRNHLPSPRCLREEGAACWRICYSYTSECAITSLCSGPG